MKQIVMRWKSLLTKQQNGALQNRIFLSLLIGVAITGFFSEYAHDVQADIASSVVRLHVLANSDSEHDQQLKLKVRDAVIESLKEPLGTASSVEQTKQMLQQQLPQIQAVALQTLQQNDCNLPVQVVLGRFDFPTKQYGDCQFPAGTYDALRVLIGEAEGQNWWCVLYPQLCFAEQDRGKLPQTSKQQLKNVLTEDEMDLILADKDDQPLQIKFKLVEWFAKQ